MTDKGKGPHDNEFIRTPTEGTEIVQKHVYRDGGSIFTVGWGRSLQVTNNDMNTNK